MCRRHRTLSGTNICVRRSLFRGLAQSGIRGGGATYSGTWPDGGLGHRSRWGCGRPERGTSWRSNPLLPLARQIMQEAEVITRPSRETHGHGGRRAPEPQLPPSGSRVVPQICTDVRTRDVSSDRRNDTWSSKNVLVHMVVRMQQDLADIRAENRLLRTPGFQTVVHTPRKPAFTTTKVPRFGGTTSWKQYRQVFDAIVLSNGWDDATALSLQVNVPMSRRTSRTGLVDALSAYYG